MNSSKNLQTKHFFNTIKINEFYYFFNVMSHLFHYFQISDLVLIKNYLNAHNLYKNKQTFNLLKIKKFYYLQNYQIYSSQTTKIKISSPIKNIFFIKKNIFYSKIFKLLFLFNYNIIHYLHDFHYNYKLLFSSMVKKVFMVNNNHFITQWLNSFSLIYNIFYYKLNPLIFGSPIFKKEILGLNWNNCSYTFNLWNLVSPTFIFQNNHFSVKNDFFYKQLNSSGLSVVLVSDSYYHYKNLYYFKKHNFFSIALTQSNLDPWLVTYAIPALSNNFFTQYFFLKICNYFSRLASYDKFIFYKKIWFNSLLINYERSVV